MSGDTTGFIAALDVGTTTIRCHIIDKQGNTVGKASTKVKLHYPEPRSVEIDPDELWSSVILVIKNAVRAANTTFQQIRTLGISTQRATFVTWRKDNGKHLHNFITWKDLRATELIREVNNSWRMKALRGSTRLLYLLTGIKKLGVASKFKFSSNHVTIRLLWMLTRNPEVKAALKKDNLVFGTMETWLVYKLTSGKTHVTDITNASATGMYDPFQLDWSFIPKFVNIPEHILPTVVNNDYDFGVTEKGIFGAQVQIGCTMADQSASMFGSINFKENDLKVTLGTGAFLDINTGKGIQSSLNGMYPLVGWQTNDMFSYISEVPCHDCGSLVEWMLESELISSAEELNDITELKSNEGVYFIPAFSGLGPPINDETCGSGWVGITPKTKRGHLVKAVLESIVYKIALAYEMLKEERCFDNDTIVLDGGVSRNDCVCQILADLTELTVKRLTEEMSIMGVAFVAGLSCGFWKTKEDLSVLSKTPTIFQPSKNITYRTYLKNSLREWQRASERFLLWQNI